MKHGLGGYARGCKCPVCTEARRTYDHDRQARPGGKEAAAARKRAYRASQAAPKRKTADVLAPHELDAILSRDHAGFDDRWEMEGC